MRLPLCSQTPNVIVRTRIGTDLSELLLARPAALLQRLKDGTALLLVADDDRDEADETEEDGDADDNRCSNPLCE